MKTRTLLTHMEIIEALETQNTEAALKIVDHLLATIELLEEENDLSEEAFSKLEVIFDRQHKRLNKEA
jgi:hypothetical protein